MKEYFKDKIEFELPKEYDAEKNPMVDKFAIIHPPENEDAFRVESHQDEKTINDTINRWASYGVKGQIAVYKLVDIVNI